MPIRAKLEIRFVDGPWEGRSVLVNNPPPAKLTMPARRRDGSMTEIEYVVEKGPHGFYAQRRTEANPDLPTIGWRGWLVVPVDGVTRLRSASYDTVWPNDGPLVAACPQKHVVALQPPPPTNTALLTVGSQVDPPEIVTIEEPAHPAPDANCTCGIYVARSLSWLRSAGYGHMPVFGLVSLWGRFVEYEQGWRYERGYPLALIVSDDYPADGKGDSSGVFGARVDGATSDDVDHATAARMATVAQLRMAYRVPVALGSAERGVEIMRLMADRGLFPKWSASVLPADVRLSKREEI